MGKHKSKRRTFWCGVCVRSFMVSGKRWREERDGHYASHGKRKRDAMNRRVPGSFESNAR